MWIWGCIAVILQAHIVLSKSNLVVYWGQASAKTQDRLVEYCKSESVDVVALAFFYEFPNPMKLDFGPSCTKRSASGLLTCPEIGQDIKACQEMGKTVLLSLGGDAGHHEFKSEQEAIDFGDHLWNMFGKGHGLEERPFGDAVVDGFDFDFENKNQLGIAALAKRLRQRADDINFPIIISAAPQCPYPDESLSEMLSTTFVDMIFIQFYNNPVCALGKGFNWDTWDNFAKNVSPNKQVQLYIGLPGSPSAAGSGYVGDVELLLSSVEKAYSSPNFSGIMLWDASQAFTNVEQGMSYAELCKIVLEAVASEHDNEPKSPEATVSGMPEIQHGISYYPEYGVSETPLVLAHRHSITKVITMLEEGINFAGSNPEFVRRASFSTPTSHLARRASLNTGIPAEQRLQPMHADADKGWNHINGLDTLIVSVM